MQHLSCPYTPEQNGTAERKHRHIVEHALAMLSYSQVPLIHWDDAFSTSVYLINRTLTPSLHHKTPLEKLTRTKPDYHRLKVFGCLCYPLLRSYNRQKLENKIESSVFLGYSLQYKGYKALLPNKKVVITRHITYDENLFPFATASLSQNHMPNSEPPIIAPLVSIPSIDHRSIPPENN